MARPWRGGDWPGMAWAKGLCQHRGYTWGLLGAAWMALPLLLRGSYYVSMLVFVELYTLVALGVSLLIALTGQISLAQAAFYGIGGYTSAILTTRYGLSPWLALLPAIAISAFLALVSGLVVCRLKAFYLALTTFALGTVSYVLFMQLPWLTGGVSGLGNIPSFSIGSFVLSKDVHIYYLAAVITALAFLFTYNISRSRVGRAMKSFHPFGGSEMAAEALGINPGRLKLQAFVLAAIFASLAGSIYAHYMKVINPTPFSPNFSLMLFLMVVIGGQSTIWGAPVGAGIVVLLGEVLREVVHRAFPGGRGEYEVILLGIIFIIMFMFRPAGLVRASLSMAGKNPKKSLGTNEAAGK